MNKIQEIFNFDDIGEKIKTLAKWSCWITIVLVWISAIITFLVLLFTKGTFFIAFLVPVFAILYSLLIWIGSWTMYAFGKVVEDIHAMRNKEVPVIKSATNLPPVKDIFASARESASTNTVKRCPYCGDVVKLGRCEMCGKEVK